MSDFPSGGGSHVSPEMASMMGDFQKNSLATVSPGAAAGEGSGGKGAVLLSNGLSGARNVSASMKGSSSSSTSSKQVSVFIDPRFRIYRKWTATDPERESRDAAV